MRTKVRLRLNPKRVSDSCKISHSYHRGKRHSSMAYSLARCMHAYVRAPLHGHQMRNWHSADYRLRS